MLKQQIPAYFNWSGGKDSCLALYRVLRDQQFDVKYLVTTFNSEAKRVSMHGVRLELMEEQAKQLGIPLVVIEYSSSADMIEYEAAMLSGLKPLLEEGIVTSLFGDIFLEDLKQYRIDKLREIGVEGVFPLWNESTTDLVNEFIDLGFKTITVCVDATKLEKEFTGKIIDQTFLQQLPEGVDPCGENGEFHTFVYDGPIFKQPVQYEIKEIVERSYPSTLKDGVEQKWKFYFIDLDILI